MTHLTPSYRVPSYPRLLWIQIATVVVAALILWLSDGSPVETSNAYPVPVATYDVAEPTGLVSTSQGDDSTAFREEDAGFSAHHRVPDHFTEDGQDAPRLNVKDITEALLADPGENDYIRRGPGRHVDSGANFGIIELPMVPAPSNKTQVPPTLVTVYFDDRGWVVAYLPADAPSAGIWRYDPTEEGIDDLPTNDLTQNLLVLAINEVLEVARKDVHKIVDASHDTVGYYHWQYPDLNSFALFSHRSDGGTSDPLRFVVPPTIQTVRASAAILITDSADSDQPADHAQLLVDEQSVVEVRQPSRLAVSGFDLDRISDVTRLYEVTVAVDEEGTAEGVVMLLYTKPSS